MNQRTIQVLLSLLFAFHVCDGQKVSKVVAHQEGQEILIQYNLRTKKACEVLVWISEDDGNNWQKIQNGLSGEFGKDVKEGSDKLIRWKVLEDRDRLVASNVKFKVKAILKSNFGCNEVSTLLDPRDGQEYQIVTIGTQTWMAQNLNYATGNSCCYNNNTANCATYGRLYDWQTAKGACPAGWHLPSDAEWTTLTTFLGGESVAGGKMKSVTVWNAPNTGATNQSCFSALPGGYRGNFSGLFLTIGLRGYWWSATEDGTSFSWSRYINYDFEEILVGDSNKENGLSVRCLRD